MALYRVIMKNPKYIEEGTKLGLEELKNMPDKYGKLDHLLGKPFSAAMLKEIQAYASEKLENVIPKNVARYHIFKWLEDEFPGIFQPSEVTGMVGQIETPSPFGTFVIHTTSPNKKDTIQISTWMHERAHYHLIFVEVEDHYVIIGYYDFMQIHDYLEVEGYLVPQKNRENPLIVMKDWRDTIKPIDMFLKEIKGFIKGIDIRDLET